MEENTKSDALSTLRGKERQIHALTYELGKATADARQAGASWAEIGNALGITRQAAQQRYAGIVRSSDAKVAEGSNNPWLSTPELATEVDADPAPADSADEMLEALGPSAVTKRFFQVAKEQGLRPEVQYKAEMDQLTITVDDHSPGGGWTLMNQFKTDSGYRHFFSVAYSQVAQGKRATRAVAMASLRRYI